MRDANGTGSAKTLTLYVDGASADPASFPATASWDTWGTQSATVTLAAGTHAVAYRFTTADSGNVNLDALDVAVVATGGGGGGTGASAGAGEAENWFMAGGAAVATSTSGCNGTGYATESPVLANGIGIYGGAGNRADYNVIQDTAVSSAGIAISTRFSPVTFSGTTSVQHNTLTRTGGYEPNWADRFGGL